MSYWTVAKQIRAGQIVFEVIRVRNAEKEILQESDIDRYESLGLFPTLEEATELADRLNKTEK